MAYIRLSDSVEVSDSLVTGYAFSNFTDYLNNLDKRTAQEKLCYLDRKIRLSRDPVNVYSGYIANSFCLWLTHTSNLNKEKYVYRLPTLNEMLTSNYLKSLENGLWCLNNRRPYLAGLSQNKVNRITTRIKLYLMKSLFLNQVLLNGLCQIFNLSFDKLMSDSGELIADILDIVDFRSVNLLSLKWPTDTASLIYNVRHTRSNYQKNDSDKFIDKKSKILSVLNERLQQGYQIIGELDQTNDKLVNLINQSCKLYSEYEAINLIMNTVRKRFVSRSEDDPYNYEAASLLFFIVVLILAHSRFYSITSPWARSNLQSSSRLSPARKSFARLIRRHLLELMEALIALAFCEAQLIFDDTRFGHIKLVREDVVL